MTITLHILSLGVPVGLQNNGNTCYFNSALQCLFNSKYLVEAIKKDPSGEYAQAGLDIIKQIENNTQGKYNVYDPIKIKQLMAKKNKIYAKFNQEDSHEFFVQYLDTMKKEQNKIKKPVYKQLDYDNLSIIDAFNMFEEYQNNYEKSEILDVVKFTILTEYKLTCGHDGINLTQEESLMLNCIIKVAVDDVENVPTSKPKQVQKNVANINEAINAYFAPIDMEYKCPICKQKCTRTERKYLFTIPKQLIITLARSNKIQKISSSIPFSLELDLIQYAHPQSKIQKARYDLNAVSLHSGSMGGGHYTAYVKRGDKQYDCNDSSVRETKIDTSDSRAYLFSYALIKE